MVYGCFMAAFKRVCPERPERPGADRGRDPTPCDCKCPAPACVEKLVSRTGSKYSRLSSPFAKIFRFSRSPNHLYVRAVPLSSQRGGSRSSRTLGAGCDGRVGVAGRATLMRTAKTRGPDPPTLGSSLRVTSSQATVAIKPGHRGERAISRQTIVQGMPDCSGGPVVTNACAFYQRARGCGCIERPAFPAPSVLRGTRSMHHSGAKRAAGMLRHVSRRHCERSEAIQTASADAVWIASSLRSSQ